LRNIVRWHSDEYDQAYPVKRAALFIKMNELVIADVAVIPVVYRPTVAGLRNKMVAPLSGWDNYLWLLSDWYREA
jgi:peptide/nickel transport system substrate-binding protein